MLTGKFLFTLLGMILAIFAICNTDITSKPVVENWWGSTQFTHTGRPAVKNSNGEMVALPGNNVINQNMMGNNKFFKTANFQAVLSPRFSNTNYGANIKYNLTDQKNLATPCDPLTFGDMAKENFTQKQSQENYGCSTGNCPPSCGKGGYGINKEIDNGYGLKPGYTNGNYQDVYDSLPGDKIIDGDLPVFSMTTMDGNGDSEQFVSYSRLMPANSKSSSRLYSQSDFIRGDLPIVPCNSGWFSVSPNLARDVNAGAMNVITDVASNSTYADMIRMVHTASGGAQTSLGGGNIKELPAYSPVMSGVSETDLSSMMSDITVTSYP